METALAGTGSSAVTSQEQITRPSQNAQRNTPRTSTIDASRENERKHPRRRPHNRVWKDHGDEGVRPDTSASQDAPKSTYPRRRNNTRPKPANSDGKSTVTVDPPDGSGPSNPPGGSFRRGAKFNAGLTDPGNPGSMSDKPAKAYRNKAATYSTKPPEADNLTSRLIHSLSTPPYLDCPICFNPIHPMQRTWSCSPSIPIVKQPDMTAEEQQYCWTVFHVKCIGEWAAKSVKEVADAWRARGEDRKGDWRCPGCQAKREVLPSGYWCFCHSTSEPKPPRLATPHSCASPCSRVRESGCGHPCPLTCHPGPCPPCQITTRMDCYCPRKEVIAFRCGVGRGMKRDLSCGTVCGRKLECGNHACEEVCHEGPCPDCPVREDVKCWCGQSTKEVACGDGEAIFCADRTGKTWSGRYECETSCQIPFDCGHHRCESSCHPPHELRVCPLSPSLVTTCPCGARPIARSTSVNTPVTNPTPLPARSSCTSPIPTCDSPCNKPLSDCDHACTTSCHTGPCPPCQVPIVRPCRCGATTRSVPCSTLHESKEILCEKPCAALRACGKHQCRRQCCPLASLTSVAGKKGKNPKKRVVDAEDSGVGTERGGLHECDLVCGRMLGCGLHQCEERDHKGACPPCLRSSFEELVCYCGLTVLEPPVPCGTEIECRYQCSRPPPPCGHPHSRHTCHGDPMPCPPCPFLADKKCACGKKVMSNVKCSLESEKVSCGTVCGKLMECGFHQCERSCHGDVCGPCTAPCGKPRKLCLPARHPCTRQCHAPSSCPEDKPCEALVVLTCPCGRMQQSIPCRRCVNAPSPPQHNKPKCNNECAIARRNAKLADALGVTSESREKAAAVKYHDELVSFARANGKFLGVVEKALEEFVASTRKAQILPHMPPDRRKFVHDLALVYRMDAEMVDQEPNRSVRIIRRPDTRIPSPLLSRSLPPSAAAPNLGKLADLRKTTTASSSSWRASPVPSLPKLASSGWSTPKPTSRPTSAAGPTAPAPVQVQEPIRQVGNTERVNPVSSQSARPIEIPMSPTAVPDSWEDD